MYNSIMTTLERESILFPNGEPELTAEQYRAACAIRDTFQSSRIAATGSAPTEAQRQADWAGAVYEVTFTPEQRDTFNA
jgi:hypothetical protein